MHPPAVLVRSRADLLLATASARPVLLLSAPDAAAFAGAGWWHALTRHALTRGHRAALDCGNQPGRALEAFAAGCPLVVLLPCPAWADVAARAAPGTVLRERPRALDLADPAAVRHLDRWLGGAAAQGDSGTVIR